MKTFSHESLSRCLLFEQTVRRPGAGSNSIGIRSGCLILGHLEAKEWQWISSEAVGLEIAQMSDEERRTRIQLLASHVDEMVRIEAGEVARAQELQKFGFHGADALHLACAESGTADVFLTTDDRLLRLANRISENLRVQVANPLAWLAKVTEE